MNLIYRLSILSALMLFIGLSSTPAAAYLTCSGCRINDAFTIPGSSADSVGGSYTIPGSSAYSVSGDSAYSAYGRRGPDYGGYYWYVPGGAYAPDDSGADYYVLGGRVYR